MQGIAALGRLSGSAYIEPWCVLNVNMLVRALRDTTADNRAILLLIRPWRMSINEGCLAGF